MNGIGTSVIERKGRTGKAAAWVIDLTLLVALATILVKLIWTLISPTAFLPADARNLILVKTGNNVVSPVMLGDPGVFSRFNPFNRDLLQSDIVVAEDTPETTLNLKIKTLFSSTEGELSFVRIETPNSAVERFMEGDTVIQGVTLDRILNDRIVLLRNGQREALLLREESVFDSVTSEPRNGAGKVQAASPSSSATTNQNTTSVAVETASTIRLKSFDAFYNGLTIRRMASDDGDTALFIQAGSDPAILDQTGLREGDELVLVNQYNLRDDSLSDLFENLRTETEFNVVIRRDGQTISRKLVIE